MAGETDKEDYTDLKFELEFEWEQDHELRAFVKNQQKKNPPKKRPQSPYYRFKTIDEERKMRKE